MILIPNYGSGNLASIARMVSKAGGTARITTNPHDLVDAKRIILAGVGEFDSGMSGLSNGWIQELNEAVLIRKIPVLGICLGMHLMCNSSEEGALSGLGWVNAEVKKLSFSSNIGMKVPHMGWNTIEVIQGNKIIRNEGDEQRFYFVHSYYVSCNEPNNITSVTNYGIDFVSAFFHENIYGVQFHPEKSHKFGMNLIKRFINA